MILHGDCLSEMRAMDDNSVDSIVTDPPYELGFMGKSWDNTGIAYNVDMWKECLRVLKPGGHLLAFGGTRTYHRMAVAIEDAGFEIRDMIEWVYGSGFPKSHSVGKAVDKLQGNEREVNGVGKAGKGFNKVKGFGVTTTKGGEATTEWETTKGTSEWEGWGTALKPAHEPICMARKPLAEKTVAENVLKHGTGGINIDESRVGTEEMKAQPSGKTSKAFNLTTEQEAQGTGILAGGMGEDKIGRFPANLIHDNSEEVRECFPETKSAGNYKNPETAKEGGNGMFAGGEVQNKYANETGNASRFFKSIQNEKEDALNDIVADIMQSGFDSAMGGDVFKSEQENKEIQEAEYDKAIKNGVEKIKKCFPNFKSIIYQAKASKSERNKGCEDMPLQHYLKANKMGGEGDTMLTGSGNPRDCRKHNNHPTVKPIKLMQYLTRLITPKGGTVLDPFMGSGSTGIACKKEGFDFIGVELDKDYFEIAKARIEKLEHQHELFKGETK